VRVVGQERFSLLRVGRTGATADGRAALSEVGSWLGGLVRLDSLGPSAALAALELRSLEIDSEVSAARQHPAFMLDRIAHVTDEKTGERFGFHVTEPGHPWYWQRAVLDAFMAHMKVVVLKARQIGITWLACGLGLWIALYKPGTRILIYRQKEEDAAKLVGRIWDMYRGLPVHLRGDVRVLKPMPGRRPHLVIQFEHPDGTVSTVEGMASTESAGHGDTAALILLDEGARIDKLRAIWKAVVPTVGVKARIILISTGNGVSVVDEKTGESFGNYFHRLWTTAKQKKIFPVFLPWWTHPDRDEAWFEHSEEVANLDPQGPEGAVPGERARGFRVAARGVVRPGGSGLVRVEPGEAARGLLRLHPRIFGSPIGQEAPQPGGSDRAVPAAGEGSQVRDHG
jgi:hypothetical protein